MFIEFNATTEDVGIRASLDGEPWNGGQIIGPDHQRIFQVSGVGNLGEIGLTELSFATHELAREDLSLEGLLALFPEGEYEFRGRTVEGDRLLGTATLTHDIPDAPQILTPEEGVLVDPDDAVISWDPVTEPAGIEIAGYRVSVERGDRGRSLSLELPPETTSVPVPPDFLEPGTDYLFQVFAIEAGGNQTITEGVFDTAGDDPGAAEDIAVNEVCQKKIAEPSWHLCGAAPADGQISFDNVGPHEAKVFTTPSEGIQCTATLDDGWDLQRQEHGPSRTRCRPPRPDRSRSPREIWSILRGPTATHRTAPSRSSSPRSRSARMRAAPVAKAQAAGRRLGTVPIWGLRGAAIPGRKSGGRPDS